ncbi:hypothetical protein AB0M68_44185, partial [Streptomyces sp. NPDC051453]
MSTQATSLFTSDLSVVNVGLAMFDRDLTAQGAQVTTLDWTPPGGGSPEVLAALDALEDPRVAERTDAA